MIPDVTLPAPLRPVTLADVSDRYLGWLNDPVVNRYLETRWTPQSLDSIRGFVSAQIAATDSLLLAIEDQGVHVGNLKIGPINRHHRCADVSYFIGERSCWGKGLATAAIRAACDIAFARLDLHRLQAGLYAGNVGSLRALEKAGFTREGVWRQQLLGPDGWEDHIFLGMLRQEWTP